MRFVLIGLVFLSGNAFAQSTLDAVKSKGFVQCGVNTGLAGFSQPDSRGVWKGIDVDVCRAVAAAVFGDHTKVRYTPLTAQQRFTALQSGEVDLLARTTTYTLTRDTALGFDFTASSVDCANALPHRKAKPIRTDLMLLLPRVGTPGRSRSGRGA